MLLYSYCYCYLGARMQKSRTAVSDGRMEWADVMMLLIMINALGGAAMHGTAGANLRPFALWAV